MAAQRRLRGEEQAAAQETFRCLESLCQALEGYAVNPDAWQLGYWGSRTLRIAGTRGRGCGQSPLRSAAGNNIVVTDAIGTTAHRDAAIHCYPNHTQILWFSNPGSWSGPCPPQGQLARPGWRRQSPGRPSVASRPSSVQRPAQPLPQRHRATLRIGRRASTP